MNKTNGSTLLRTRLKLVIASADQDRLDEIKKLEEDVQRMTKQNKFLEGLSDDQFDGYDEHHDHTEDGYEAHHKSVKEGGNWFKNLTDDQQKHYLESHPNSKYGDSKEEAGTLSNEMIECREAYENKYHKSAAGVPFDEWQASWFANLNSKHETASNQISVSDSAIIDLFTQGPSPTDDQIHQIAADHGLTPDEFENRIYYLFHQALTTGTQENDMKVANVTPVNASILKPSGPAHKFRQLSSLELALVKNNEHYEWFSFTGDGITIRNAKGRPLTLSKGNRFGVRKSASGKDIRLITEADGPTIIFTLDQATAQFLGAKCVVAKAPK